MHTRIRSCVPHDDWRPCSRRVRFELTVHDVGREQQRALPKLRELVRPDRLVRLGRRIDDDDFISAVDEILRHGLGLRLAEDAAHEFLLLGDVLEIDRRENRNPRLEQLLDIFIALSVPAPWRVVVRQAVDQADLRVTCEDRRHVDDGHTSNVSRGNALERSNHLRDFRRRIGLRGGDDDVLTPFVPAPALVEQLERFSDARGIAEKDLQLSAVFRPLGRLDLPKQRFRVAVGRAIVVVNTHRRLIPKRLYLTRMEQLQRRTRWIVLCLWRNAPQRRPTLISPRPGARQPKGEHPIAGDSLGKKREAIFPCPRVAPLKKRNSRSLKALCVWSDHGL